jgi:zinc/manganese transport system ATP-binding protein
VITVLHDLDLVRRHFDQALLLAREAIAWGAPSEVLVPAHLAQARQLHEAFDDDAPLCAAPRSATATEQGARRT